MCCGVAKRSSQKVRDKRRALNRAVLNYSDQLATRILETTTTGEDPRVTERLGRVQQATASETWLASISSANPSQCSGELPTQKLKSHLMRTQSLNVLSLKSGVGQYIAMPEIFLPCLLLHFRSIHLHFSKTSLDFSCVGCC